MVEANEELKVWGQPQDNPTVNPDDLNALMIVELEKKYN